MKKRSAEKHQKKKLIDRRVTLAMGRGPFDDEPLFLLFSLFFFVLKSKLSMNEENKKSNGGLEQTAVSTKEKKG